MQDQILDMAMFTRKNDSYDWSELHVQICQCLLLMLSATFVLFDKVNTSSQKLTLFM